MDDPDGFVYVASPYSHPDPEVESYRFREAGRFVAWAMRRGIHAYSPIVHCHPLAVAHKLPGDAEFWGNYNRAFLSKARAVFVLELPGWELSRGIKAEIGWAEELGLNVEHACVNGGDYDVRLTGDGERTPPAETLNSGEGSA